MNCIESVNWCPSQSCRKIQAEPTALATEEQWGRGISRQDLWKRKFPGIRKSVIFFNLPNLI